MAEQVILDKSILTGIGNIIRENKGITGKIPSVYMESELRSIIAGGGGSETPPSENTYLVRYIDYDGTILKEEYVEKGGTTSPPSDPNPDPDYLVFNSWDYDTSTYVVNRDTNIYAIYNTIDGASYFFIRVTGTSGLALTLAISGFTSIDWGDGTVDASTTHTYATGGDYIIKVTGAFTFIASNSVYLMGSQILNRCLYKAYLGTITSIGYRTFYYCYSLKSITIPNSVTSIGNDAFRYCFSLQSITIPDGITSIGNSTFNSCNSLQSITIPYSVTSIGMGAFGGCNSLQSITIPNRVTSIGGSVFSGCNSLQSITIPDGITSIEGTAFHSCYSLKSITIPNSVTSIGSSAFYYCYSLKSITIPDGVTSIGNYAFTFCRVLQSITIPDGVTSIGNDAFSDCYSLKSITIPNSVTSIGNDAFNTCNSLQSITIPYSVTSIGSRTFYYCYSLKDIIIDCTTAPTLSDTNAFTNISPACIFWVNDDIIEDLKVATNWSTYASKMKPKSEKPADL